MSRIADRNWVLAFVCIFSLSAATTSAAPVLIDNFADPANPTTFVINLLDSDPYNLAQTGAGILGGERELTIDVQGVSGPVSAVGTIGGGQFLLNSGVPGSLIDLSYNGIGQAGLGGVDLVDGTNTGIRLDFGFVDPGSAPNFSYEILLANPSGSAVYIGSLGSIVSPTSIFVPFNLFTVNGGFQFTSVEDVIFQFNLPGTDNVDFSLTTLTATVPEPASIVLAGLGALAAVGMVVGARRR